MTDTTRIHCSLCGECMTEGGTDNSGPEAAPHCTCQTEDLFFVLLNKFSPEIIREYVESHSLEKNIN